MDIRLTKEPTSLLWKHQKGKVSEEIAVDPANYPNLVQLLKDCDDASQCTGVNVLDIGAGYEVALYAADGWGLQEQDKGALFMYNEAEEGFDQLDEAMKTEIDNLLALL
jgi:hypothetical protein